MSKVLAYSDFNESNGHFRPRAVVLCSKIVSVAWLHLLAVCATEGNARVCHLLYTLAILSSSHYNRSRKPREKEVNAMETRRWYLTAVGVLLLAAVISYLILRYACRKPVPSVGNYLLSIFMFWLWIFTIYGTPRKRRERLKKAELKRGYYCGPWMYP